MKLSASSFLFTALHVIVLSTEVIPSVADDPAAAPTFPPTTLNAGDYEIEVVVNDGGESGPDTDDTATDIIAGVDPFNVTSFFEVSNKYNDIAGELNEVDQENNIVNAITVEVYTTVIGADGESEDDCSKGDLIEDAGDFTISAGAVNHITDITYPSPRNDDYFVGATVVQLTNFMSNVIYVANVANEGEDTATGGTVEFCVRTSFKLEDETVSHIDSKKKIMVDLVGNFASLTVNNIVKADNKDFEVTVVKEINVETSVCNIRNEPVDAARTYKIGEQFRICVGPQEAALEEGYEIDNFVEVTCGSRSLVESGTTDGLTSIEALPLKNNRRAMKSVITTGYAVDGATTLSCTGKVSLSYTAPAVGGGGSGGGNGGVDPDGVATTGGGGSGTTTDTALAPAPTFAPTLDPTRAPTHAPTVPPPTGLGDYSSQYCIELCATLGNRRIPIPADMPTRMDRYILQSGLDAVKAMYGNEVNCWDISQRTELDYFFNDLPNFNEPLHCWNTAHITSLTETFRRNGFNQDLNTWDTSSVTGMSWVFNQNINFNGDVSSWDTSKANTMAKIFAQATGFNQDISSWDTSNVENMDSTLHDTYAFNQDIGEWDTSRVTNMYRMFYRANIFNQDINGWDTGSVTMMYGMFHGASIFDQDINGWDTSNASNIQQMFNGAFAFNRDISGWDTSNVRYISSIFDTARNFNQNLCNWNVEAVESHLAYIFGRSACQVAYADPDVAMCQPCGVPDIITRRLGSSSSNNNNNSNNSINRNSNNKHRTNRNHQGIVGDDDTSVVAPFHTITTVNKADDGPVALQQTVGGSITTGTSTLQALRDLQPITGLDPSGAGGGGAEELLEGLFELNIEMDIPSNESSAPLSSSMTTTVVVIAFGSILFVVSSMIY